MRFLPNEHKNMLQIIEESDHDSATVLFVKRRGWLYVDVPNIPESFCFFREKKTRLDNGGDWRTEHLYYMTRSKQAACTWQEVLAGFRARLSA